MLKDMPDVGVLLEIFEGQMIPVLTDYHLQPVPSTWNARPPSGSVGGLQLVPAFTDGDCYTIYCIEPATREFVAIDLEAPWPPIRVFRSCAEFRAYLFKVATENSTEQAKAELRELLGIKDQ